MWALLSSVLPMAVACGTDSERVAPVYSVGGGIIMRRSDDGGLSWSEQESVVPPGSDRHDILGLGSGHGILTASGLLLVPVWYVPKGAGAVTAVLYSDDLGKSWNLSDEIPCPGDITDPNEFEIAECADGSLYANARIGGDGFCRAVSRSAGGLNFSAWARDESLPDLQCKAGLCAFSHLAEDRMILFSNCASLTARENLVLRASVDGGATFPLRQTVDRGAAGYSDIAVDSRGCIYVFYEVNYGERLVLAATSVSEFMSD